VLLATTASASEERMRDAIISRASGILLVNFLPRSMLLLGRRSMYILLLSEHPLRYWCKCVILLFWLFGLL
jgi:hypothetical protein